MMTKLRSGQGKRYDADADTDVDADAADQSNTYMSPFQATQKSLCVKILILMIYILLNETSFNISN